MNEFLSYFLPAYFILINALAFIFTLADKVNAKSGRRRIREKTLLLLAILGGSVTEYLTMLLIRHKTKHKKFMFGIPVIIIFQVLLGYMIFIFTL